MTAVLPRRSQAPAPRRRMYVAFVLGGRSWAIPAEQVAAVGELGPVTRLPTADPARLGLAVHGGRAVALLAAGGAGANGASAARHLIVLRAGGGSVALAADELAGIKVEYGEAVPAGFELLESRRMLGEASP